MLSGKASIQLLEFLFRSPDELIFFRQFVLKLLGLGPQMIFRPALALDALLKFFLGGVMFSLESGVLGGKFLQLSFQGFT